MSRDFYNPPIKTCQKCGKEFICHEPKQWAYKIYRPYGYNNRNNISNYAYYCSWTCKRGAEREKEEMKKKGLI